MFRVTEVKALPGNEDELQEEENAKKDLMFEQVRVEMLMLVQSILIMLLVTIQQFIVIRRNLGLEEKLLKKLGMSLVKLQLS